MCCFDAHATIAAVESLLWSDQCVSNCLSKFGQYVEKQNVDV